MSQPHAGRTGGGRTGGRGQPPQQRPPQSFAAAAAATTAAAAAAPRPVNAWQTAVPSSMSLAASLQQTQQPPPPPPPSYTAAAAAASTAVPRPPQPATATIPGTASAPVVHVQPSHQAAAVAPAAVVHPNALRGHHQQQHPQQQQQHQQSIQQQQQYFQQQQHQQYALNQAFQQQQQNSFAYDQYAYTQQQHHHHHGGGRGGHHHYQQHQQQHHHHQGYYSQNQRSSGGGGGVYYPPPQQQQQMVASGTLSSSSSVASAASAAVPIVVPAPRQKKLSVITDKDGNPLDFSTPSATAKPTATTTPAATTSSATSAASVASSTAGGAGAATTTAPPSVVAAAPAVAPPPPASDAGAKMRQLAEEALGIKPAAAAATPKESALPAAKPAESGKEAIVAAKDATPAAAADQPVASLAGRVSAIKLDDAPVDVAETEAPKPQSTSGRTIYTREQLLSFKNKFTERPESLPDLTITKIPVTGGQRGGDRGGGGSRGGGRNDRGGDHGQKGGGGDWSRGSAPPRREANANQSNGKEPNQWSRGHAPPPQQQQQNNRQGGRGGKQQYDDQFFDGPVAPLVKSENHWRPKKSSSAFDIAEKQVMSVLNKMTKEKFAKLSEVMVQIPITSSEILTLMIDRIYEKAIDEPAFGDIYADLCYKLSYSAKVSNFVHIFESDEEPPMEGEAVASDQGESTSNTVYRWTNDLSASDAEIVGPFDSEDACWDVALSEEEETPIERGDMELELVRVAIRRGIFVKIMKKKDSEEDVYYTVYFPVQEAAECGQQMSEIFLSEVECKNDANKKNKFKRSLLNKCEEEFNKKDIYAEYKEEKEAYEQQKALMTEAQRAEKEEEFNFRRIRIKKQMLGNVKFIGQLFKKKLLKEKIMRYCIAHMLQLDVTGEDDASGNPSYKDSGRVDIDEEDHEALCSIFTTIGATIDTPGAADFMNLCFTKIKALCESKALPSRSRFMYRDLLDLRSNRWVPRRKEEKAKTLEEIRKDVEREERLQAQISAQAAAQSNSRGGFGGGRGSGRGGNREHERDRRPLNIRARPARVVAETDDDGFTTAVSKNAPKYQPRSIQARPNGTAAAASSTAPTRSGFAALAAAEESGHDSANIKHGPEPLDIEELGRRVKSMSIDYMNDNGNVDELLLSFDEISGTPDAGRILVSKSMDRMCDCKDDERSAIFRVLIVLYEKKKITAADVQEGMADTVEFIDSIVVDAPKAFAYLGDILSDMLRLGAIDMAWLAARLEQCKEADAESEAPQRTIKETLQSYKVKFGADDAKALAKGSEQVLVGLLGESALELSGR